MSCDSSWQAGFIRCMRLRPATDIYPIPGKLRGPFSVLYTCLYL